MAASSDSLSAEPPALLRPQNTLVSRRISDYNELAKAGLVRPSKESIQIILKVPSRRSAAALSSCPFSLTPAPQLLSRVQRIYVVRHLSV